MTEPKFRAWDKERQKMYEVDNIDFRKELINVFVPEDIASYCSGNVERPFSKINLMQYTGLKDKNGVEIYEGDIAKAIQSDHYFTKDKPVQIYTSITIKIDTEVTGYSQGGPDGETQFTDIEVVGNIHENPKLLEIK